ncbi:hypothetical protein NVV93_08600 [Pseudomonas sp. LS44]|uniref:hypothetical protein n=1 Tax=Pseudomonas sp. LS44 TaxID=1357074 RepID=UPI00215B14EF|nr:hypothetical protein [Pseudomonas sp. LS44]UVE19418.1 hypothetical protein NVV93_08600 [Pseudomonas sp. LS44]
MLELRNISQKITFRPSYPPDKLIGCALNSDNAPPESGVMSRSRRKNPIVGYTTATSEAEDKALWHRALRRAENQRLATAPNSEAHHPREFSNPWSMDKDGKHWLGAQWRSADWARK